MQNFKNFFLITLCSAFTIVGCKKGNTIGEDPYAGGKEALGVKFDNVLPLPEVANWGEETTVFVRGLKKFDGKFKIYVNEVEANIVSFTDSTARIKVPDNSSTGGISVVVDAQIFFGPILKIEGNLSLDETFMTNGASYRLGVGDIIAGTVFDFLTLPNGNIVVAGGFNNFDNKWTETLPNGSIATVNNTGSYVVPSTALNFGKGVDGGIRSIHRITSGAHNGKLIVSGSFNAFLSPIKPKAKLNTMFSITRLNSDGTVDSAVLDVVNPTPELAYKNRDTVPVFNGGVDGLVLKSFVYNNRLYALGIFNSYYRTFYDRATYDTKPIDIVRMNQMVAVRINEPNPEDEGMIDFGFHYDPSTKQSFAGGNGSITDAIQQGDGKMILVGNFTTFNGVPANRIVRINLDGSVDPTFNTSGGADAFISKITYNATTNKILVAGIFKNFGGVVRHGVAMLNPDGSLVTSFKFDDLGGGSPNFAAQLADGKVLISGNFKTYMGVVRQGFMVLEADGTLAKGYNNTGEFIGQIYKIQETISGNISRVLVAGRISRFDNRPVNSLFRVLLRK